MTVEETGVPGENHRPVPKKKRSKEKNALMLQVKRGEYRDIHFQYNAGFSGIFLSQLYWSCFVFSLTVNSLILVIGLRDT